MNSSVLMNFYRCTIESLLTSCITVWYGNCPSHPALSLQRVVESAQHIAGNRLPAIQDTCYHQRCRRKAHSILKDHSQPTCSLFSRLPLAGNTAAWLHEPPDSETATTIRPSDSSTRAHSDNALLHNSLYQAAILCILVYYTVVLVLCFR